MSSVGYGIPTNGTSTALFCRYRHFPLHARAVRPRPLGKVHVIYDGLDETAAIADPQYIKAFREPFSDGAKLVGVVGRIKWHRKGQEVLVRAAALIRHRHPEGTLCPCWLRGAG